MVKVDSKGRIVLPKDVRERLGIAPGAEVEVREEEGRAVVEPEADPESIVEDLERRIERASAERDRAPERELTGEAREHREAIRRQAERTSDEGSSTDE